MHLDDLELYWIPVCTVTVILNKSSLFQIDQEVAVVSINPDPSQFAAAAADLLAVCLSAVLPSLFQWDGVPATAMRAGECTYGRLDLNTASARVILVFRDAMVFWETVMPYRYKLVLLLLLFKIRQKIHNIIDINNDRSQHTGEKKKTVN